MSVLVAVVVVECEQRKSMATSIRPARQCHCTRLFDGVVVTAQLILMLFSVCVCVCVCVCVAERTNEQQQTNYLRQIINIGKSRIRFPFHVYVCVCVCLCELKLFELLMPLLMCDMQKME